jgi:hypothetical protein
VTETSVRPAATRASGRTSYEVLEGDRTVAWVVVTRARQRLESVGIAAGSGQPPAPEAEVLRPADAVAWPAASAQLAAERRWADRHPSIATVARVTVEAGELHDARTAVEAVGTHLASAGIRRLDVRAACDDPVVSSLLGPRWVHGTTEGDRVAGLALGYPWSERPDAAATSSVLPLPLLVRRFGRKVSATHPRQVPELARVMSAEVGAAIRLRQAPGPARATPLKGSPPGTFPFAVTRYRTIRMALSLLTPAFRATTFVDMGCGDGRVLREAIAAGFDQVHGRELDPELAARSRSAIGHHGSIDIGDGLLPPLPDDAGVVFLFNPFTAERLDLLAGQITDTLARRPRPLALLYVNPRPIESLERAGLVLVEANPAFSVLITGARR